MDRHQFEQLIEESLQQIPAALREAMNNLAIVIEPWPERELMAQMGFCSFNEMIGRSDLLGIDDAIDHRRG